MIDKLGDFLAEEKTTDDSLGDFLEKETGPGGHKRDGSGPPEHGMKKGPGKGREICKEEQSEYQKFFKSKLDERGIKSPNELSDNEKREFFDNISKEWKKEKAKP